MIIGARKRILIILKFKTNPFPKLKYFLKPLTRTWFRIF